MATRQDLCNERRHSTVIQRQLAYVQRTQQDQISRDTGIHIFPPIIHSFHVFILQSNQQPGRLPESTGLTSDLVPVRHKEHTPHHETNTKAQTLHLTAGSY